MSGLLAALLALVSQVAVGAAVLPVPAADEVAAAATECTGHPPPGHHHNSVPCQLCLAAELPGALITPAPVLPAPTPLQAVRTAARSLAHMPPGRVTQAALPRGPPASA